MKVFFALAVLLMHANVQAGELEWQLDLTEDQEFGDEVPLDTALQKMVTLSTDRDNDKYYLHLMQDSRSQAPSGMFVQPDKNNARKNPKEKLKGRAFRLADIESAAGAPVFEADGRKVLILQGLIDRTTHEGRLQLKYLANGLSMRYESCDVLLRRNGNDFWVQNAYTGEKVTNVKVTTYFLGVITLEGICPVKTL